MNETINNGQSRAASKLLSAPARREKDKAEVWRWMVEEVDLEVHRIISVLWAADQLQNDSSDTTVDDKEKNDRVILLVSTAKEMAANLRDEIDLAYSEIQHMKFPNKPTEHRQDRVEV